MGEKKKSSVGQSELGKLWYQIVRQTVCICAKKGNVRKQLVIWNIYKIYFLLAESSQTFKIHYSESQCLSCEKSLRLFEVQKALQQPLFSTFSFSLQQIWTDWQKFFVNFFTFVKLGAYDLIWAYWKKSSWRFCWLLFRVRVNNANFNMRVEFKTSLKAV